MVCGQSHVMQDSTRFQPRYRGVGWGHDRKLVAGHRDQPWSDGVAVASSKHTTARAERILFWRGVLDKYTGVRKQETLASIAPASAREVLPSVSRVEKDGR
jgi:hypothetical protein